MNALEYRIKSKRREWHQAILKEEFLRNQAAWHPGLPSAQVLAKARVATLEGEICIMVEQLDAKKA